MATTEDTAQQQKGPSFIVQIAVLLALTGAAVGAGWFAGQHLNATQGGLASSRTAVEEEEADDVPAADYGSILALPAIMTNLAGPGDVWVRMELALVFDGGTDSALAEFVHQDVMAYMRTVKLGQVEGPSGFQHLKSDLEERARIRTDGRVKSILIRTLLFE